MIPKIKSMLSIAALLTAGFAAASAQPGRPNRPGMGGGSF